MLKKIWVEKLVKMLEFCQNSIFGQKFDFLNCVLSVSNHAFYKDFGILESLFYKHDLCQTDKEKDTLLTSALRASNENNGLMALMRHFVLILQHCEVYMCVCKTFPYCRRSSNSPQSIHRRSRYIKIKEKAVLHPCVSSDPDFHGVVLFCIIILQPLSRYINGGSLGNYRPCFA